MQFNTGEPLITNQPSIHPHAAGIPSGHPALNSFLGLPFYGQGEFVGMVGIANRPEGYDDLICEFLKPFLNTCSNIILSLRHKNAYEETLLELTKSRHQIEREKGLLQAILNSALDGVITIDQWANITSVNPAAERLFGYSEQELLGKNVKTLMPEPYRGQHDQYIYNYITTGKAKVIGQKNREVKGKRKDGTLFPMDLAVGATKEQDKWLFTGIVRDITERIEAKNKITDALQELKKSHDDLLAILDSQNISTIIVNDSGKVEFVSKTCCDRKGIDAMKVANTNWEQLLPIDKESIRRIRESFVQPENKRERVNITYLDKYNRRHWIECEVHDYPRKPKHHILFIYDVSDIHELRQQLNKATREQMIGSDSAMLQMYELINDVSNGDWTVLIEGETGVGKELVARSIHAASPRSDGPFIAVNSAGLTESLIASQLFGHKRGAFTGAVSDQKGLFEAAIGGTIFLDEIGDIPMPTQKALLRVLQEKEVTRVGETKPRKVDVRIVAATHKDLKKEIENGNFRQDLYYRICVARVAVPSLRQRQSDIQLLAYHFLTESLLSTGKKIDGFSEEAMKLLLSYKWPGNVRELKHTIEAAVVHCKTNLITVDDLSIDLTDVNKGGDIKDKINVLTKGDLRSQIIAALDATNGNRKEAAKLLGMSRATFYRRLSEYNIFEET